MDKVEKSLEHVKDILNLLKEHPVLVDITASVFKWAVLGLIGYLVYKIVVKSGDWYQKHRGEKRHEKSQEKYEKLLAKTTKALTEVNGLLTDNKKFLEEISRGLN